MFWGKPLMVMALMWRTFSYNNLSFMKSSIQSIILLKIITFQMQHQKHLLDNTRNSLIIIHFICWSFLLGFPHGFNESMNCTRYRAIDMLCNYFTTWHSPILRFCVLSGSGCERAISSCNLAIALKCTQPNCNPYFIRFDPKFSQTQSTYNTNRHSHVAQIVASFVELVSFLWFQSGAMHRFRQQTICQTRMH